MANDRDASISDAAFREALDAMLDAIEAHDDVVCCESDDGSHEWVLFPGTMKDFLRARVLALYAERQGEVYEVAEVEQYHDDETTDRAAFTAVYLVPAIEVAQGNRVRVTKVARAK